MSVVVAALSLAACSSSSTSGAGGGGGSSSDGGGGSGGAGGGASGTKACVGSCTADADCRLADGGTTGVGLPACSGGACVQCNATADCPTFFKGGCNTTTKTCKLCATNADCAFQGAVCDTATGSCGCATDGDCSPDGGAKVGTGKCDTASKSCYKCAAATECTALTGFGFTACTAGKCANCASDADCSAAPRKGCDTATGTCSKCKTAADCGKALDGGATTLTCSASGACECANNAACTGLFAAPPTTFVCK